MRDWKEGQPRRARARLIALSAALALCVGLGLQRGADHQAPEADDGLGGVRAVAAQAVAEAGWRPRGAPTAIPLDDLDPAAAGRVAVIIEALAEGSAQDAEILRVTVERPPGGQPTRVGPVFDLTGTEEADERLIGLDGQIALISTRHEGQIIGLVALDFAGEPERLVEGWGALDRAKNRVSNWQETGQAEGISRLRVMFSPPLKNLHATPLGGRAFNLGDDQGALWRLDLPPLLDGDPRLLPSRQSAPTTNALAQVKGQRPHLGWLVDTVRDLSWVGPAKIARLEDLAFDLLDWGKQRQAAIFGQPPVEAPVLAAAADPEKDRAALLALNPTDGDRRWRPTADRRPGRLWPPRAATPIFKDVGPGEGQWVPMTSLINPSADGSIVFVQSWIRPDKARHYAQVSVTAWDTSRVHIGVVGGTREPQSRTGLKGTGQIPRRAEITPRLIGAFNGGFQSKHGAYGMIEERAVISPPMGLAATLVATDDGRALMGTWPAGGPPPNQYMRPPGAAVPGWVFGMRQNLDPLVDGGRVNPARRLKWGSTAGSTADGVFTVRTGVCLLEGGAMAYFFGASVSAEMLGAAMLAFHCEHGIHLDMNAGHSGFEFYNVQDIEGRDFKAARMIAKMWHMNFPRYIQRDARDFFYLTHRALPLERLEDLTGLSWRHPDLGSGHDGDAAPGEPARVLVADITLGGGESHAELTRLPRQSASGALLPPFGGPPPTQPHTVLLGNLEPGAASHRMSLALNDLGALRPADPSAPTQEGSDRPTDASVPVTLLADKGKSVDLPEPPPARVALVALSDLDLIVTQVQGRDVEELRRWLLSKGFATIVALPCPADSEVALRLVSDTGEEAFRGGPLRGDRPMWRLDVAPALPWTDRVERHVQAPIPASE